MRILSVAHFNKNKEIKKVLTITLCWAIIQAVFYVHEYCSTLDLIHKAKLMGTFEFWPDFINTLCVSVFGGVIGGTIMVIKLPPNRSQNSLLSDVVFSGLLFITCYLLLAIMGLLLTGFIYFALQADFNSAFHNALDHMKANLLTPSFLAAMTIWGLLVSGTQFTLQISEKFGEGMLWKFVIGSYRSPKEEERIFMFLDLKGATSIAEKMESSHYFHMLKEIYRDITAPITQSSGEIYQYVGDEIVISWPMALGIKNNNALQCFFLIERKIAEKKSKYLEKYGIVPTFKAGLHLGKATIGEIGVAKREIVYSGDVLNTTSRIQSLCNHYNVRILISSALLELLKLGTKYISIPIGEIGLRGKEHKVYLNTVQVLP